MSRTYPVAEKFKSVQGEGLYAGTPMAFIRFVGCSVGKKICNACDTDFETSHSFRGGGLFSPSDLLDWAKPYSHICLTGGEPLDQDLLPLFEELENRYAPGTTRPRIHIESSGTKDRPTFPSLRLVHPYWLCVSPKPGFKEDTVLLADEVKVIVPGLGSGAGWPTLSDAKRWAAEGKTVFLQPRNTKHDVDQTNLRFVLDAVAENPELRASVQLHKILKVQ